MKKYKPKTLKELIHSLNELSEIYGDEAKVMILDVRKLDRAVYPYEINGISVYGRNVNNSVISILIGDTD